jgi:hypothetical protein
MAAADLTYNHAAGSTDTGTYRIDKSGLWCLRYRSINYGRQYCTTVYHECGGLPFRHPLGYEFALSQPVGVRVLCERTGRMHRFAAATKARSKFPLRSRCLVIKMQTRTLAYFGMAGES